MSLVGSGLGIFYPTCECKKDAAWNLKISCPATKKFSARNGGTFWVRFFLFLPEKENLFSRMFIRGALVGFFMRTIHLLYI